MPARGGSRTPLPWDGERASRAGAPRDLLGRQGVPIEDDVLQGLLLIVSELVTNAVKHAALLSPELAVEVAVAADWVRVSVEDDHPYRPTA
ncbi:ATPase, partial [Streptomyces sp. CB02366]